MKLNNLKMSAIEKHVCSFLVQSAAFELIKESEKVTKRLHFLLKPKTRVKQARYVDTT